MCRQIDRTRKKFPECVNPDSEINTQYVLTNKWILYVKERMTRLQSIASEKLGNNEDPKRDTWITLGRRIR